MQLHVWDDTWADDESWQRAIEDLKRQGKIRAFGISVNRWEPTNVIRALRTGYIDSVQVIYNIFDQNPEDELFPLCAKLDIGIIARVPFDEGSLTGSLTKAMTWPKEDWRNSYFTPENLSATVDRAESLRQIVPSGTTMSELALRFILANSMVSTIIPGMRKVGHVESNAGASDCDMLSKDIIDQLRLHRWVRTPTRAWAP
jgi:aryl-alcohol dehydrogenase-like predicted oxidoreductase